MNKSRFGKIIAASLAILVFAAFCAAGIMAASYDSSENPLVSLNYLRDIFKPELMSALESKIDAKVEIAVSNATDSLEKSGTGSSEYVVVELGLGDALFAEGACDIMLRSGSAYCIAPDESQGIADYTSGYEIYDGMSLTKNHMCLIPRGDGRGIIASSESVFIMVRGEYTVVEG